MLPNGSFATGTFQRFRGARRGSRVRVAKGRLRLSSATICLLSASASSASASGAEKDQFNILNPTPRHLMREMVTDRPDQTEVPFTVDAGHVQFESDLFSYAYDDENGTITNAWAVMPTNIRI